MSRTGLLLLLIVFTMCGLLLTVRAQTSPPPIEAYEIKYSGGECVGQKDSGPDRHAYELATYNGEPMYGASYADSYSGSCSGEITVTFR